MITDDWFNAAALQADWRGLDSKASDDAARDLFEQLTVAYSAPDRHYHTAKHIAACLQALHAVRQLAEQPAELAIALWFHDAVYDAHRSDNETLSADWCAQALTAASVAPARVQRVRQLILATAHHATSDSPDEQLLVDIDLGILGQDRATFADYDRAIRKEYHWVPPAEYAAARRAVLQGFLARPRIYGTAHFSARFESAARVNLTAAVNALNAK